MLHDYQEFLQLFKKHNHELGHIYIMRKTRSLDTGDDWDGKINATNNLIKHSKKKLSDEIQSVRKELKDDINEMKQAILEIKAIVTK